MSFTNGTGPSGYTELSPDRLAAVRARVGAAKGLAYLTGSGPVVAQSYGNQTLAYTTYTQWRLIAVLSLVLVLGIIGELFVPTLPFNIPRRAFGLYSWLALLQSQVRGLGRVPCISTNWPLIFRSSDLRWLVTSISS